MNDTYHAAWNSIPPTRPAVLKTFLGRITRNISLDRYDYNTAKKRTLFIRRYWYSDSIKEIANLYGFSESKVKSILLRLRMKLKDYLEKEGISI